MNQNSFSKILKIFLVGFVVLGAGANAFGFWGPFKKNKDFKLPVLNKIIGGELMAESDHRSVVYVYNNHYQTQCTAGVLHRQWLVLAAHCVVEKEEVDGRRVSTNRILAPDVFYVFTKADTSEVTLDQGINVDAVYIHPDYFAVEGDSRRDVALIHLTKALPLGENLSFLFLPSETTGVWTQQFFNVRIEGYGITGSDQPGPNKGQGKLRVVEKALKGSDINIDNDYIRVSQGDSKGFCLGDSGTSLTTTYEGHRLLLGVASFVQYKQSLSEICADEGVFVNVLSVRQWIIDTFEEYNNSLSTQK